MKNLIIIIIFVPILGIGQENKLSIFRNLIGNKWKAEGTWFNGKPFKQIKTFEYNLDSTIIVAKTNGFIDKKLTKLGNRNYGIRHYDKKSDTVKFWEFDVFGGLTTGIVFAKGKNIFYQYDYGKSRITNLWEFVNVNTYNFKVGIQKNGKFDQLFLETKFVRIDK
ncbi:MAG: hypothetical protein ACWA42_05025 [Lutibacter sp.]